MAPTLLEYRAMSFTRVTKALAVLMVPTGLVLHGCGASDGESGQNGTVRFSQVLDYGETRDFSAPVAAGRPLFVALQHPKEGFLDDETYAELTLRVEREDGSELDAVWPFGFAQYGLRIEDPGTYWLIAEDKDQDVDALSISVEDLDRIEVSEQIQLETRYDDGERTCTRVEEVRGLGAVTLHRNQRLELFVVPRSASGEPMLGLLALSARTSDQIQLDAPLFGQGRRANALTLTPRGALPTTVELSITDEDSGETLSFSIPASNEDFVLECD